MKSPHYDRTGVSQSITSTSGFFIKINKSSSNNNELVNKKLELETSQNLTSQTDTITPIKPYG